MGLIECASGASCWRGHDYYLSGKVLSCCPMGESKFEGRVEGAAEEPYEVRVDIEHPRRSSCNCPHAKDRRVVCKHQIALYFEAVPGTAEFFVENQQRLEDEYYDALKRWKHDRFDEIVLYVDSLTPEKMRDELINALANDIDDRDFDWW